MKTTYSDNIVVIGGNVEISKTAPPNAFVLLSKRQDRRYRKFVTAAEHTPSERMKHTCNTANTAVVYLVQGRVDVRILVISMIQGHRVSRCMDSVG